MKDKVKALADQYFEEVVSIRRHMHMNPELSFEEFETSKFITSKLDALGISYQSGYVKTGIVATIEGGSTDGPTVALRADMDALPINETKGKDYCSTVEGVMHACGHDAHTASMLGAAKILSELKDSWKGQVKLFFQPGEEKLPGGASLMIKEGAVRDHSPSKMFGQHVYPDIDAGKVGFRPGMYMASTDELYLKVIGKGGHAALPHKNIDPVLIASHIVVALQQVVSRRAVPYVPTVLSFGKVIANGATNVIPDEVNLEGTFRTFDEEWRAEAAKLMVKIATGVAESMGGSVEFEVRKGYPFLVNDEVTTEAAKLAAIEFLGKENVVDLDLRMTAEDFAYFSQEMPACFYRLGTRGPGAESGLHTATFDIDEKALKVGMGLMAYITLQSLGKA